MANGLILKRLPKAAVVAAVAAVAIFGVQTTSAQSPQTAPASGWATDSKPTGQDTQNQQQDSNEEAAAYILNSAQLALVAQINAYLNTLENVEGRFVQTDHLNEETKGRFYVRRPGRLRFDYSSPSRLRIVSDGEYLSVEDHDLKTVDKFPLDATPVQLLLGDDVNLTRDAVILDMRQDPTAVTLTLRDKSGTAAGHIQLFFKLPDLSLYEWIITDAQGLETRIQFARLVEGEERADSFFASSDIELDDISNN